MYLLRTFILFTTLHFFKSTSYGQALILYRKVNKPDYCAKDTAIIRSLIGRKVKIFHDGGVYKTLNTNTKLKWPSEEVRQKSGENGWGTFRPKTGDTGIIVHIFRPRGRINRYTYLLKVGGYYVPTACSYLTDIDKLDSDEQAWEMWIRDSIQNVEYAAGCKFKIRNDNWSRAGLMNIDKQSEGFACELIAKGIDTVMLCKYIFDNGSLAMEKAFILWLANGQGYVKSFFNNSQHEPTNNGIAAFESRELISYFFENRLDTLTSEPQSNNSISHSLGYSIQLYTRDLFFRERLTDFLIREDPRHPKSVWWKMVSDKLAGLKEE